MRRLSGGQISDSKKAIKPIKFLSINSNKRHLHKLYFPEEKCSRLEQVLECCESIQS